MASVETEIRPRQPTFTVEYKVVKDCHINTDVYLPEGPSSKYGSNRPVAIFFHGGAFMVGHSNMNSPLQIADCVGRGWIVVAPDHRLCPGVSIQSGPQEDARDVLRWVVSRLDDAIRAHAAASTVVVDPKRIVSVGASSGGCLALSLAFGCASQPPVAAIVDFYGAKDFRNACWNELQAGPRGQWGPVVEDEVAILRSQKPVPTRGGPSFEGQAGPATAYSTDADVRFRCAIRIMGEGRVLRESQPDGNWAAIDPVMNVSEGWPPTWIVHGTEDVAVPLHVSRTMERALKEKGVPVEVVLVPGEGHTFLGKMQLGSETWRLQRTVFDKVQGLLDAI